MDPDRPTPVPGPAAFAAGEITEPHARSIKWIARIYLVLAIICCFFIFLSMAISSIKPLDIDAMKIALFNGAVFATLYWGLRRRASWLPPTLPPQVVTPRSSSRNARTRPRGSGTCRPCFI